MKKMQSVADTDNMDIENLVLLVLGRLDNAEIQVLDVLIITYESSMTSVRMRVSISAWS